MRSLLASTKRTNRNITLSQSLTPSYSLINKHNYSLDPLKKRCLIFPGQGAQYVGMGKDIYDSFPYIKSFFNECDDIIGYNLSKIMFEGPLNDLTSTIHAQPAVLIHSLGILRVLQNEYKLFLPSSNDFSLTMGLSLGEYTALTAAECFNSVKDSIYTVDKRANFMQECCINNNDNEELSQKMLAVLHDGSVTINYLEDLINNNIDRKTYVSDIANYNSPKQIVISGHKIALDNIMSLLKQNKIKSKYINTGGAFHSSLMLNAKNKLIDEFKNIEINLPKNNNISVISNVQSTVVNNVNYNNGDIIKELLCNQVCETVNWYPSVLKAINEYDIDEFIEIGPKSTLSGMVKIICNENNIKNIATNNFDTLQAGLIAN